MKYKIKRIKNNFAVEYRCNGKLHRTNGPAIIWPTGTMQWYNNGKLHRTDGPAYIWEDGTMHWYLKGKES